MCSRGAEGSAEQRAQPEPSHTLLSGKGLGNWEALEGKKINNNKRLPELYSPLQHSQLNAVSSLPLGMEASGIRSALGGRADGDVKGIGSGPSEEETLREAWGLDAFPDSIFDNGTKPMFEKSLLLTTLLAK